MNCLLIKPGDEGFEKTFQGMKFSLYPAALLPLRVAQNDTLDEDRLLTAMVATENDQTLARAALYRSDADDAPHTLIIGNYEADSDGAAALVLAEAEKYARENNFNRLLGPMNGSTWSTYRFRTDSSADVFFSEHWHPAAYLAQWKNAGFTTSQHYISTLDTTLLCDTPEILALEASLEHEGLRIRALDENDFQPHNLEKLFTFCTTAFSDNVFYAPISRPAFEARYSKTAAYLAPGSSAVIEDSGGHIHGLLLAYPDHFCKTEKRFIIKTVARHPKATFKGLGTLLANLGTRYAHTQGYTSVIHAYMHTGNASIKISGKFSAAPLREYVLLEKVFS
ncbi:MAG: hypothetical protein MUC87_06125 [Bacteroidia bacterium]|jgi:hypothetical protein|nr:hypothetical protein [Bacteroidia bacterium]